MPAARPLRMRKTPRNLGRRMFRLIAPIATSTLPKNGRHRMRSLRRRPCAPFGEMGSSAASKATTASKTDGAAAVDGASDDKARRKAASIPTLRLAAGSKGSASGKDQPPARTDRRPRRPRHSGKALERFGYLGTWQGVPRKCSQALPLDEPWTSTTPGLDAHAPLRHPAQFIAYTFCRRLKTRWDCRRGFRRMEQSGLVDRHEDIYACFEPSDPANPDEARAIPGRFRAFAPRNGQAGQAPGAGTQSAAPQPASLSPSAKKDLSVRPRPRGGLRRASYRSSTTCISCRW